MPAPRRATGAPQARGVTSASAPGPREQIPVRPTRRDGGTFPLIADYAFLSDCHTGALVAPDGSVEWLCLPRFDGPSVFGAMLESADSWAGIPIERRAFGPNWLDGVGAILHPATLTSQPRRLLQAVAAGVAFYATAASGLDPADYRPISHFASVFAAPRTRRRVRTSRRGSRSAWPRGCC